MRVRVIPDASPDQGQVLVAYALSRRTGGAVTRNRARRRLRAVVSELDRREDGPLPGGSALLFGADAAAAEAPYPELCRWVEGALARAVRPR